MNLIDQILFASRGRNPDNPSDRRGGINLVQRPEINDTGFSNTITSVEKDNYICEVYMDKIKHLKLRIRKLIPKECCKLFGIKPEFDDLLTDIGISDTQKYKQYGNGIITNCVSLLFEHLYKAQHDESYVCTDEKYANFQNPQLG